MVNLVIMNLLMVDLVVLVYGGKVYLYIGYDEVEEKYYGYVMKKWLVFFLIDMVNWM